MAHVPATVDVRAIRQRLRLSLAQFAARYGFALDAVKNWEQGRRQPDTAARAFLMVIAREPEAVERALSARSGASTPARRTSHYRRHPGAQCCWLGH